MLPRFVWKLMGIWDVEMREIWRMINDGNMKYSKKLSNRNMLKVAKFGSGSIYYYWAKKYFEPCAKIIPPFRLNRVKLRLA